MIPVLIICQLIILFAGIAGILNGNKDKTYNGNIPLEARLFLSFSLVVSAFVLWMSMGEQNPYHKWILFGMIACFSGDIFMSGMVTIIDIHVDGPAAFILAHGFYIMGMNEAIDWMCIDIPTDALLISLSLYIFIVITGWFFLYQKS